MSVGAPLKEKVNVSQKSYLVLMDQHYLFLKSVFICCVTTFLFMTETDVSAD